MRRVQIAISSDNNLNIMIELVTKMMVEVKGNSRRYHKKT